MRTCLATCLRYPTLLALVATPSVAIADSFEVHAAGALNVGYTQIDQDTIQADPTLARADGSVRSVYTELLPDLQVLGGTPRVRWGAGYQFSGRLDLNASSMGYTNQAQGSLLALPSPTTTLALTANVGQGSSASLARLRSADAGTPELRAPGNLNRVVITVGQGLGWELGRVTTLRQTLTGTTNSPTEAFTRGSSEAVGTVALERQRRRTVGALELRARVALLRPLQMELDPYVAVTNAAVIRGHHDLSPRWNVQGSIGIEQAYTADRSQPVSMTPTASVVLSMWARTTTFALEASHSAYPNLEVGTIAIADRIMARGSLLFDEARARALRFSAGFMHDEPLGSFEAVPGGIGDALQADAEFVTAIGSRLLFSARYGVMHQFERDAVPATMTHLFLVGVVARYSSTGKLRRPLPSQGKRVDQSDATPMNDAPPPSENAP